MKLLHRFALLIFSAASIGFVGVLCAAVEAQELTEGQVEQRLRELEQENKSAHAQEVQEKLSQRAAQQGSLYSWYQDLQKKRAASELKKKWSMIDRGAHFTNKMISSSHLVSLFLEETGQSFTKIYQFLAKEMQNAPLADALADIFLTCVSFYEGQFKREQQTVQEYVIRAKNMLREAGLLNSDQAKDESIDSFVVYMPQVVDDISILASMVNGKVFNRNWPKKVEQIKTELAILKIALQGKKDDVSTVLRGFVGVIEAIISSVPENISRIRAGEMSVFTREKISQLEREAMTN